MHLPRIPGHTVPCDAHRTRRVVARARATHRDRGDRARAWVVQLQPKTKSAMVMRLAASLLLAAGAASALDWDGEIDLTKTTKEFMGLGGLSGGGGTTCVALAHTDSRCWPGAAAPAVRR